MVLEREEEGREYALSRERVKKPMFMQAPSFIKEMYDKMGLKAQKHFLYEYSFLNV